jgi:hypothetical protein
MLAMGIILSILLVGFASGYAVREFISRPRHAEARRKCETV